jgi:Ca2+-binding RTX toxin-like protein
MAVFIGNGLSNIANATGVGTLIGFVGGNIALLQDAIGDTIVGFGGNDVIVAGNGNDVILGGDGNDFIDGRFGFDVMDGGAGIDTMDVSFFGGAYVWNMATGVTNFSAAGEFAFNFENARTGAGNDSVTGTAGNNSISTGAGNDIADGADGNDSLFGEAGNDRLFGGNGNDFLFGGAGNDSLAGGNGNDVINGGAGVDVMNGGAGFDDFDYNALTDSGLALGAIDIITGFQNVPILAGAIDQIDLSTIDANPFLAGNQAFVFRDVLAFSGVGQVRWFNAGGNTFVDLNTDLDAAAEMRIQLNGIYNLDAVDFIL